MTPSSRLASAVVVFAAAALTACGGGRGNEAADIFPSAGPAPVQPVAGPDSFLLFPNAQRLDDGTLETNSVAYAQAYYAAIDPGNTRDTLAKWKAANGFDQPGGTQVSAVFG